MADKFDFIIIGGGPAGATIASNLSKSAKRPSVLLIEAGGAALPVANRQPYHRFLNAFVLTDRECGYSTVPQKHLGGRQLPYARGKGLGGSSALNFMVFTKGASADWDRWAELVGDKDWSSGAAESRLRRIENFHGEVDDRFKKYVNPKKSDHGYEGPIHVSIPGEELEEEVMTTIDAAIELGFLQNMDCNSGDVIGISVGHSSYGYGKRSTADALLEEKVENLTIWTHSPVSKVLFEGKTATGVETVDGRKVFASNEVIVCAGSIDTPKLLLLSGIGPENELKALDIDVVHNLPAVGKNVSDHLQVMITNLMDRSFSSKFEFALDEEANAAALKQWTVDGTGPLATRYTGNAVIFDKLTATYDSDAFKSLDAKEREWITKPGVPHFELIAGAPLIPPDFPMTKETSYSGHAVTFFNPQSKGEITLQSKDPLVAPLIDPNYLSSPYDKELFIAAIKLESKLMKTSIMSKHYQGPINAPVSDSDADIDNFIQNTAGTMWHLSSTAKMGKAGDTNSAVGSDLRVFGTAKLRVADISVCPFTPNTHTQAAAYVIGLTAADKIIAEYGLNVV